MTFPGVGQWLKTATQLAVPDSMLLIRGSRARNAVHLTFDDGPDPEHTPRLLDGLQLHGARATFFVIGDRARRYPAIIRRIVAEGHALGHHSYLHAEPSTVTAASLLAEVRRTASLLEDLAGLRPTLFRPPRGELTVAKALGLWTLQQTIVLWNADPRDYRMSSAEPLRQWVRARPLRAGDLVLLHDNHPHALAALPDFVAQARRLSLWLEPVCVRGAGLDKCASAAARNRAARSWGHALQKEGPG